MKLSLEKHFDATPAGVGITVYKLRNTQCRLICADGLWRERLIYEPDLPFEDGEEHSADAIQALVQRITHSSATFSRLVPALNGTVVYDDAKRRYEVLHPGLSRRVFCNDRRDAVESLLCVAAEWGGSETWRLTGSSHSLREKLAKSEAERVRSARLASAAAAYVKAIDERGEVFEASRKAFLEGDESIDMKPRLDATWEAVQATYAALEAAVKAIGNEGEKA